MTDNFVTLNMTPLRFYSNLDEKSLLRNLNAIPSLKNITHIDRGLEVTVDTAVCDWDGFKDILSLFLRYKLDINELVPVVVDQQIREWFLSPQRDWHDALRTSKN